MLTVSTFLLHKHNIFHNLGIRIETYLYFINRVQNGYNNITYHNKTHAADLASTAYFMLTKGGFMVKGKMDDIDFSSMIIGGVCHDLGHFGVNNVYLVEKRHDIAIRYNDASVLENHHVASAFALM